METIILETQSFQFELDAESFAPLKMSVTNADVADYYEDDKEGLTLALIRELAVNLQASKELLIETINEHDEEKISHKEEVTRLEDYIDTLEMDISRLHSDNEMLRDELDNAQQWYN